MGASSEKLDIINSLYKKSDKEKREGVGGGEEEGRCWM